MLRRGGGGTSALAPSEDDEDTRVELRVVVGACRTGRGRRRKSFPLLLRSGDELLCRACTSPSAGGGEEEEEELKEVPADARDGRIATYRAFTVLVVMRRGGDA